MYIASWFPEWNNNQNIYPASCDWMQGFFIAFLSKVKNHPVCTERFFEEEFMKKKLVTNCFLLRWLQYTKRM